MKKIDIERKEIAQLIDMAQKWKATYKLQKR